MPSNSRMGEFFSVSVEEIDGVALSWSNTGDLYCWEYEMTSTLGSDIRRNVSHARAIHGMHWKGFSEGHGCLCHWSLCRHAYNAGSRSSLTSWNYFFTFTEPVPLLSSGLPGSDCYCVAVFFSFLFFLRLTFSWSFVKSQLQANLIFIQLNSIESELEVNCYLMSPVYA